MQTSQHTATIESVLDEAQHVAVEPEENPFQARTIVVVTLGDPREKFWGTILSLNTQGLSLCGVELGSFDNLISMVKDGEPFSPSVVFFPMHRMERIELDLPEGNIPSLAQRFAAKTGLAAKVALTRSISESSLRPPVAKERK